MKKAVKTVLIIAGAILILGIVMGGLSLFKMDFDFEKLSTDEYKTVTYDVTPDFNSIIIDTDVQDITFLLSENEDCKVVCTERNKVTHSVTVENDTLTIKVVNNRKWYDHIGIFIGDLKMTVYLPKSEFNTLEINSDTGDVEISKDFIFSTATIESDTGDITWYATVSDKLSLETDTGDIKVDGITLNAVEIDTDTGSVNVEDLTVLTEEIIIDSNTGDIRLTRVVSKTIKANSDTGDVILTDSTAYENINIDTNTGDVTFNNADAENIYVNTDTGDVRGTLTTEKIFLADTDTGKISLPHTTSGGTCKINTSTGDIKLDILTAGQ